jgi:single-strand DNA-binding protein
MTGSVNKVILVGNLGKDPESRTAQSGDTIVTFSVATTESWNDKQSGERRERTEWHKVVVFNQHIAGVAERFLSKGAKVYLEGTLQTRKWTDQQGQEKYTTEIVLPRFGTGELRMLSSRAEGGDAGEPSGRPARTTQPRREPAMAGGGGFGPPGGDLDDIPFGPQVL